MVNDGGSIDSKFFENSGVYNGNATNTDLRLSIDSHSFGAIQTNTDSTIIINLYNDSSNSLTSFGSTGFSPPFSFTGGTYPGTGGNCTTSFAPGASFSISVSYTQTTDSANDSTSLGMSYFNGEETEFVFFSVDGSSYSYATLDFIDSSPHIFTAQTVGFYESKSFIIQNNGNGAATNITAVITDSTHFNYSNGSYPGLAGDCGTFLAPGSSCVVEIEFAPASIGNHLSDFVLNFDDSSGNHASAIQLDGTGL